MPWLRLTSAKVLTYIKKVATNIKKVVGRLCKLLKFSTFVAPSNSAWRYQKSVLHYDYNEQKSQLLL